jgi:short-subunit dehydrogenase
MSKWALITGASSGLGIEFARIAASHGYSLVLTARREEALTQVANELIADPANPGSLEVRVVPVDLQDAQAGHHLLDFCRKNGISISLLVNNAGFGDHGLFSQAKEKKLSDMVDLNCRSLTNLTQLFLPDLILNGNETGNPSRILNVASVAAFQPGPFMAVYYASKAYVLSLSEALWKEFRVSHTPVTVTALCPGPVRTGFQETAGLEGGSFANNSRMPGPYEVAFFGMKAAFRGRRVATHGLFFRVTRFFQRFLPQRLVLSVVTKLQSQRLA